jgi:hypothetical protein
MSTVATLAAKLTMDSNNFETKIDNAAKKLQNFGARATEAGRSLTGFLTVPIAGALGLAVDAASDLNESLSAVGTTYGDAAAGIISASEGAAKSVMMSQQQYLAAATVLGVYGQAAGLTGDDLTAFGNDSIRAAADLASFYNIPVDEALEAIQAGLRGEAEPLSRFGILMNEASLEAYALEQGIWDGTGAMTDQQKILARQGFIMDNLGAANGDAARTADSFANRMKTLRATLVNVAASIGNLLLPYAISLASKLQSLADRFQKLGDGTKKIILIFALIAAAIGPLLMVIGMLAGSIGSIIAIAPKLVNAFKVVRLAMMSSLGPILIIVAALAILYLIWSKDLFGIKTKITKWFDAFKQAGGIEKIKDIMERIKAAAMALVSKIADLAKAFWKMGVLQKIFDGLKSAFMAIVSVVATVIAGIISRLDPLKSAFAGVVQMVQGLIGIFTNLFQGDLRGALDSAISMFEGWLQYLSGLGGFILSLLSGALSFIWDAIASVDWVGLGTTLLGYLQTAIGQLLGLAESLATKAGEMIGGFTTWLMNYDWAGLGITILGYIQTAIDAIAGLAGKLGTKASEMLSGFVDWFSAYDWAALGTTILGYIQTAIDGLVDLGGKMAVKAGELIGGLTTWLMNYDWAGLGSTILGYIELAASYLFLPLVLYKHGEQLLDGLKSGAEAAFNLIKIWAGGIGDKIFSAVGSLIGTLVDKGKDILTGLYDGIVAIWDDTIKPWFAKIGSAVYEILSYLLLPLVIKEHGSDIMQGFKDGVDAIWDTVSTFFSDLGASVFSSIGDVSKTLWQIGWDLMDGFWSGISSMWGWIEDQWSGLINQIPESIRKFLGISSPSKVFMEIGGNVVQGLAKGIHDEEALALAAVSSLAGAITGMQFVAPALTGITPGTMQAGAITINVNGAGDPRAVADNVFSLFNRELSLRGGAL